jgi:signal transduction histidine kinase
LRPIPNHLFLHASLLALAAIGISLGLHGWLIFRFSPSSPYPVLFGTIGCHLVLAVLIMWLLFVLQKRLALATVSGTSIERRRQRLEALGLLSSGIAHDLNNLLTPILMSSRMLQRGADQASQDEMLQTIVAAASRGRVLIGQLLTFARGGEGVREAVDLKRVFREIGGILTHLKTGPIELKTSIEHDLPCVFGVESEITQVIMNLILNARDALPAGGTVTLTAARYKLAEQKTFTVATLAPGEYVAVCVTDNGVGIDPKVRDRIFDPFYSTKQRGQGTGLGLSTALGIIRSHQGAIDVDSIPGTGTRVTVVFNIASQSNQRSIEQ